MYSSEMRYSKEHEWIKIDDNIITIGITNFAQESLGDVVYLELPELGSSISQFKKFGEIESVKAVSELFAPISGKITEINSKIETSPELINSSPHKDGWILKVESSNLNEVDLLLTKEEYMKII
ncbi:MAG: glycine cleavage system protein H [Chloroflexi bacterium]|nr:glycine cleavage system protein H [Chloroflexota bacterium]|tara:strand:- start:6608 stop:6979 length:372 start_codon:yes stop_codon:yes gene_type:complete